MKVYFDNAASTPLDPEVLDAMMPYLKGEYGNPSSVHSHGRASRVAIEKARKKVSELLNASPSEIFFTSGGTESINTAIFSGVVSLGIKHAITSPVEHHAVLNPLKALCDQGFIKLSFIELDKKGHIDYDSLENLLSSNPHSFVSLMHGNNETGNLTDLDRVGEICSESDSIFHSDTVQTIAHIPFNLNASKIHFIVGSAHKFHGPKGIGLLYIKGGQKIKPFIYGGAQERNMRGGTENLAGIIGLAKALEISTVNLQNDQAHLQALKSLTIDLLKQEIGDVEFNGDPEDKDKSLPNILSAGMPASPDNDMLLFNLDIKGISVSGGSACTSGSVLPSHVLEALKVDPMRGHVRFSFSKWNTEEEVRYCVQALKEVCQKNP